MALKNAYQLQPGLWRVTRDTTGVQLWIAIANGITLYSYSEDYARLWLSREQDIPDPPGPVAA
jgi:uncharacterized protein YaeQ